MDPLSDVLRAVRLSGAYFFLVEAAPPWSVAALPARELVPRILPDAEHLISYHILTEGSCWVGLEETGQVQMLPGDVIVFPHGHAHFMSSHPGRRIDPLPYGAVSLPFPGVVYLGNGRREAQIVCGFLGCDARPFNPLLSALPNSLHVRGMADGWLAAFPQQVVRESHLRRAGSDTTLTRMADLMFIEVLRRHLESLGEEHTGWLAGLRDPVVGGVLSLLHEQPAHSWTLAGLARGVCSSRTVVAERFTHLVGMPPMQYLAQWRLQLAADMLLRGGAKVSAVGRTGRV